MWQTMKLPEVHYVLGFPNPTKLQDRVPPVFLPNQSCLYRQCCDPDFLFLGVTVMCSSDSQLGMKCYLQGHLEVLH